MLNETWALELAYATEEHEVYELQRVRGTQQVTSRTRSLQGEQAERPQRRGMEIPA